MIILSYFIVIIFQGYACFWKNSFYFDDIIEKQSIEMNSWIEAPAHNIVIT